MERNSLFILGSLKGLSLSVASVIVLLWALAEMFLLELGLVSGLCLLKMLEGVEDSTSFVGATVEGRTLSEARNSLLERLTSVCRAVLRTTGLQGVVK